MTSRAEQLVACAAWNEREAEAAKADGDIRASHRLLAQAEALRLRAAMELGRRGAA